VLAGTTANEASPVFTDDGAGVLYVSDELGNPALWLQPLAALEPARAPVCVRRDLGRAVLRGVGAGGRVFLEQQAGVVNVGVSAIGRGAVTTVGGRWLTGQNLSPAWSHDGNTLAWIALDSFVRADRWSRRLVLQREPGGVQRMLTPQLAFFIGPRWSPDDTSLLVIGSDVRRRWGIHRVRVADGVTEAVRVAAPGHEADLQAWDWSPDGRAILYTSEQGVTRQTVGSDEQQLLVESAAETPRAELTCSG
jgi:Tol biopolymer transport system component